MIPGLYENFETNAYFCEILEEHPEYFYDNIKIGAVFGAFQFCIWDGGRIFDHPSHATQEEIIFIKNFFNSRNIPIRFTFTNNLIQKEDCYDHFNNLILKICENNLNEVIVNSPILEEYIRTNYPSYSFISSTTKCLTNLEEAKKELNNDNYKMVCLEYTLNHNKNFLESLTKEEKLKTEFLINAICPPNCVNRKEHYKLNSLFNLNYGKKYKMNYCGINGNGLDPDDKLVNSTHLLADEIFNYYVPNGFYNFKIEGRTFNPLRHICSLVQYMVKPKYQIYVISLFDSFLRDKGNKSFIYNK
jgi:collagenase-like PrtC family protease